MATKQEQQAQNPLILRCNRIMEAFAKSDDERDFYLDRLEGFLIYIDLDKPDEDLLTLEKELARNKDRYCMIPKLTFYETKKIMEGFINEKVYDIDTKEKLLDIIQSKEARENFLEFIHDHHSEQEKWQTFYQERSRIRIIEWLRVNNFHFVFEEDLEMPRLLIEKLKKELFQSKVGKDVVNARKVLFTKAKTYYSNEALNPRPKRGRPPKQTLKTEIEPQITTDIYTTVPNGLMGFLFIPDLNSLSSASFSSKFGNEDDTIAGKRHLGSDNDVNVESLSNKLRELKALSSKWIGNNEPPVKAAKKGKVPVIAIDEEDDDEDDFEDDFEEDFAPSKKATLSNKKPSIDNGKKVALKTLPTAKIAPKNITPMKKASAKAAPAVKAKAKPAPKAKAKPAPKKTPAKAASAAKRKIIKPAPKKAAKATKPKKVAPPPKKSGKGLRPMVKIKPKKR